MRTVLFLTDFPVTADYAAHDALKFAQSMNTYLLHCNIFLVTSDDSVFSQGGAETKDHRPMEEDSNGYLANYRVGWKLFSLVEKVKRGQKLLID